MGEGLESLNPKELEQLEQKLESSLKHVRSRKVVTVVLHNLQPGTSSFCLLYNHGQCLCYCSKCFAAVKLGICALTTNMFHVWMCRATLWPSLFLSYRRR